MAHVALLLRQMGHNICGSDTKFFDPIAGLLKRNDVTTFQGYDVERLCEIAPDAVIVGNVISRGNPEMEFLLNTHKFPFYSFPDFLERHLFHQRDMWVVTGTHGKTTTTTLTAYLLKTKTQPGFLIGGLPLDFECGCHLGNSEAPFVIEGDEYDTAFFDKRSKFLHYAPRTLIINNLEFDHADIFRDLQDVQRAFYHLTRLVPQNGRILMNGDDPSVTSLAPCDWTQVITVGFGEQNDWRITHFDESSSGIQFDLCKGEICPFPHISASLLGSFNARNIAMACAACYENGTDIDTSVLKQFRGVARRQKVLQQSNNFILMEDFGHHPTAIHATLQSLRHCYPAYKIVACFEPACNTSASENFQRNAVFAFESADEVWLLPAKSKLYSDKFVPTLAALNPNEIAQQLTHEKHSVCILSSYDDLQAKLNAEHLTHDKTLVCCFSNGPLSDFLNKF
jgi:UDP-N-acetylmuramate-alanine ligase